MSLKKILILFLFFLLLPKIGLAQVVIDPNFNPNRIIEDNQMLASYSTMTLSEIQDFLVSKNSYLANYKTESAYGGIKSAAEIIYDAAYNNYDCADVTLSEQPTESERRLKCRSITTINPQLLLILLQKEASLIENSNPSQKLLDEATGYGCPTGQSCNPYWKGFGKQVNSAALQFLAYMQSPSRYNFKVGETYIAKDRFSKLQTPDQAMNLAISHPHSYANIISSLEMVTVKPENAATAALYNYTPHVFNGNYNSYRLWQRYFSTYTPPVIPKIIKLYPDGSLLQVAGSPGIWLIENGKKRPFLNYSAFISRFKPEQIVMTTATELDKYEDGENIKFANYSLVQTPDKQIYLLVDKEKRPFANLDTFKKIGFNQAEIELASTSELATYASGKIITATSTYVTGVLMQDTKTGGIYYVVDGTKSPLTDKILLETRFKGKKIIPTAPATLDKYTKVDPVLLADGTLIKTDNFPTVYLISNGQKRPFAGEAIFTKLGYNFRNVITASSKFLYNYPLGEVIKEEI